MFCRSHYNENKETVNIQSFNSDRSTTDSRVDLSKVIVTRKSIKEIYDIHKPFGYSVIIEDPLTHEISYEVVEPVFNKTERKQYDLIQDFLAETIDVILSELESPEATEKYLRDKVREIIKKFRINVKRTSLGKILYYLIRDYTGYGKINVMMGDPSIEDISCNGIDVPLYIWHRTYESIPSNVVFSSEKRLDNFIIRMAYRTGRMISLARPVLDSILPDGSRINMTLGREVTKHGSTFTIRKFKADPLTIIDMINYNTISTQMAALFWLLIENRQNIFICGATASGKTSLLNTYTTFIQPEFKIVTIEDTPEIQLYHKNWIRSVSRASVGSSTDIDLFALLRAAMRQRPDYIIVGEIRGAEAYTLFQSLATGHGGMSTLHADSVTAVIHRLETEPMNIPRTLITSLNVICIQQRLELKGSPVRRTMVISEIIELDTETNEILTNELFHYEPQSDSYSSLGRSYLLEKIADQTGRSMVEIHEDLEKRTRILDWMVDSDIRKFSEVTEIIRNFYNDPDAVYKLAEVGARN